MVYQTGLMLCDCGIGCCKDISYVVISKLYIYSIVHSRAYTSSNQMGQEGMQLLVQHCGADISAMYGFQTSHIKVLCTTQELSQELEGEANTHMVPCISSPLLPPSSIPPSSSLLPHSLPPPSLPPSSLSTQTHYLTTHYTLH